MSPGWKRRLAVQACRVVRLLLPAHLEPWARAIEHELAGIADDGEALGFALGSLGGLAPRAIAFHLIRPFAGDIVSGERTGTAFHDLAIGRPRAVGLACAIGASGLGIAYMVVAGAPTRYLAIQAGALAIGIAMLAVATLIAPMLRRGSAAIMLAAGAALLATALSGTAIEGAARWVKAGVLFVQPSLILLPAMIVGFARVRDRWSTIGLLVAALALAIQPDRAMAAMLAAGLAVLALAKPDRRVAIALAGAVIGFAVTLARPDTLPAVPYVDQILYSAFGIHVLVGLAVLGGSILLIVPAVAGRRRGDAGDGMVHAVFGVVWLIAVAAAALGHYPTPLVGYGGSAVIGYVLSLGLLPAGGRDCRRAGQAIGDAPAGAPAESRLRVGLA
jgi:hypothetical protein